MVLPNDIRFRQGKKMRERQYNLDYLRIFACFMVIVIHVSAQKWHIADINSTQWKSFNFYDSAVRSAVPLFIMLSGKLFLSNKKDISLRELFRKILRLFLVYSIWSLLYAIDSVGLHAFFEGHYGVVLNEMIKYHLWYLPALINIYFLIPLFISVVKSQNNKYLLYMCFMFVFFTIGKEMMMPFCENITWLTSFCGRFNYALGGLSGYFLLGYVLDKYKEKFSVVKSKVLLVGVILIVVLAAKLNEIYSISVGKPSERLYGVYTLPVFLEAILIFILFLRLPERSYFPQIDKCAERISRYTFFIYLSHLFVIEHLDLWFGITSTSFNSWCFIPILSAFVFFICVIVAWVIEKIPVVKKLII